MESNVLKVKIWDQEAGYLSWDQNARIGIFEYDPDFLKTESGYFSPNYVYPFLSQQATDAMDVK